jgi:L-aminopeptidase/D-esterase-like protein
VAAVNAAGDVTDEAGRIIAGARRDDGAMEDAVEVLREGRIWQPEVADANTVLVAVATNAALTKEQANRLATVCHDGIARAVRPAHTPSDGDIVFTIATGDQPVDHAGYRGLEALAALAVQRAIVRGVLCAQSLGGCPAVSDVSPKVRRTRR